MSPEEELRRAEQARQALELPIVKETLDYMEREITESWVICPARDVEGREWLWRQMTATRKFRELLRGTMESGKIAEARLREKESLARRAINMVRR
jgi:hypothetical protein